MSYKINSPYAILDKRQMDPEPPQIQEKCRHCGHLVTAYLSEAIGSYRQGQWYAQFSCSNCSERWGHLVKKDKRNSVGFDHKGQERIHNENAEAIRRMEDKGLFASHGDFLNKLSKRARMRKQLERFHAAERRQGNVG